jgi:hypothetical protein
VNRRDKGPQIPLADDQLSGSAAAIEDGTRSSFLDDLKIWRCVFNTDYSGWAHLLLRLIRGSHYMRSARGFEMM